MPATLDAARPSLGCGVGIVDHSRDLIKGGTEYPLARVREATEKAQVTRPLRPEAGGGEYATARHL